MEGEVHLGKRAADGLGRPTEQAIAQLRRRLQQAVQQLWARRSPTGEWRGRLASSALATATACVALRKAATAGVAVEGAKERIEAGIKWLLAQQNADGGWGDAPGCRSNIAATYLCYAALGYAPTEPSGDVEEALGRAERYLQREGELTGLARRYGTDRTFVVPILTCLAIAGRADWKQIPSLPFELGWLPHWLLRFLQIGVVSYALPALIAIGYVVSRHRAGAFRRLTWPLVVPAVMRRLRRIQPTSGGYLEAVPLTAFVCMSLLEAGFKDHPVVRDGLRFLTELQRDDGSWPVDADLAGWVTSLALQALEVAREAGAEVAGDELERTREWLLSCQHRAVHPYTGAAPGGWGWTDLPGAVPDADDTPAALLALWPWRRRPEVRDAARRGVKWLLGLQNRDGGWPTFCRGWGWLPFDRSAPDLTAHAIRALRRWGPELGLDKPCRRAIDRGIAYLRQVQRPDGSFVPLWFGNEHHPAEENPVYGTGRVLKALGPLASRDDVQDVVRKATRWLASQQNDDGSWGGAKGLPGTVEETSIALSGLAAVPEIPWEPLWKGCRWLEGRIAAGQWLQAAPIGLYFAKLWYFEELYPVVFAVQALADVLRATELLSAGLDRACGELVGG